MKRWPYLATAVYILVALQAFSIVDRILVGEWVGKTGDKITHAINTTFMIISIALFCHGIRRIRSMGTTTLLAALLVAYMFMTTLWSFNPDFTMREAVQYLIVVVGAIGIATNLDCDEYMDLLAWIGFLSGLASLIVPIVAPQYGYGETGDFRGIFSQKNVLGQAMTMGALASIHRLRAGRGKRLYTIMSLLVVAAGALASGSTTSTLIIVIFCACDRVLALIRKGGTVRMVTITLVVMLCPVLLLAAMSPGTVAEMLGKDPTLTGRTDIWQYVIADIGDRPWLGWGYQAFWSLDNPAALDISESLKWSVPQAHNGLLEMLLHLGVIGTVFFFVIWFWSVRLSLQCLRSGNVGVGATCLLSCIGVIVLGGSESVMVEPYQACTSVFFISGFMCEQALRAPKLLRHRRPAAFNRARPIGLSVSDAA